MGTNMVSIGILSINAAAVIAYFVLKYTFKNSVIFKIGIIFMFVVDFSTCLALFVGSTNILIHYMWAVPLCSVILFVAYYLVAQLVKNPLKYMTDTIYTLSNGDLKVKFEEKMLRRNDELGAISKSINLLIKELNTVINDTYSISKHLSESSNTISASAQQLSEGANEQASSSEEISANVEEMVANISQNAQNARDTEKIARHSVEEVTLSYKFAHEAINSIKEISNKITVINDIAFQTNILALNAAVEAARAGEYGRGFAVVAAEVRKLAEHSKESAEIIESISKIGVTTIVNAGNSLEKIVPEIEKTSMLVQEISTASMEQDAGANQINSAIQQLNIVTQQNASTSTELARNAKELSEISELLIDKISFFKLNDESDNNEELPPAKVVSGRKKSMYENYSPELITQGKY